MPRPRVKILAAAEQTASAVSAKVAIAVVDVNGDLVALSRLDGASSRAVASAQGKARAAILFGVPTKAGQRRHCRRNAAAGEADARRCRHLRHRHQPGRSCRCSSTGSWPAPSASVARRRRRTSASPSRASTQSSRPVRPAADPCSDRARAAPSNLQKSATFTTDWNSTHVVRRVPSPRPRASASRSSASPCRSRSCWRAHRARRRRRVRHGWRAGSRTTPAHRCPAPRSS